MKNRYLYNNYELKRYINLDYNNDSFELIILNKNN